MLLLAVFISNFFLLEPTKQKTSTSIESSIPLPKAIKAFPLAQQKPR